jgi:hypothetical protein
MLRLAALLEAEAKLNVRRKRLIDTGRLLGSIRGTATKQGSVHAVTIGSYGVPYANFYEKGFKGVETISAHYMRLDHFWAQKIDPIVVHVREHARKVDIKARPFIRPAIETQLPYMQRQLQEYLKKPDKG